MVLCEQLKEEKDNMVAQYESMSNNKEEKPAVATPNATNVEVAVPVIKIEEGGDKSPHSDDDAASSLAGDKKLNAWMQDMGHLPEKQMEVCEVCGAFLIVGDAQQRIEDHLMGKQHLGYSKLRQAVEEIHEQRLKEHEEDELRRRDDRSICCFFF